MDQQGSPKRLTLEKIKDQINQLKIQSTSFQLILDLVQTVSDTATHIYVVWYTHLDGTDNKQDIEEKVFGGTDDSFSDLPIMPLFLHSS